MSGGGLRSVSAVAERLAGRCLELSRLAAPGAEAGALAAHLEAWARALPRLPVGDVTRLGDALVIGSPDGQRPCLALVAPLAGATAAPPTAAPPRRDGDRVVGAGAGHAMGGLAVLQVLAEAVDHAALPFALMLVLYGGEATPDGAAGPGLEALLGRLEPLQQVDLAVCVGPTDNALHLGACGRVRARITFDGHGRPGSTEKGDAGDDNPIHRAAGLLAAVAARRPRERVVAGVRFHEALAVAWIRGGDEGRPASSQCALGVAAHFAPVPPLPAAAAAALADIEALAAGARVDAVEVIPGGQVPQHNPLLAHLCGVAELPQRAAPVPGALAVLGRHGVDAVGFGPGRAEAADVVSVGGLSHAYEVLLRCVTQPLD